MEKERFGAFIAEQRRSLGLTQAELAKEIHVTDKAVSRWERGVGFPDINTLTPLAEALHITLVELIRSEKADAESISLTDASTALKDSIQVTDWKWKRHRAAKRVLAAFLILLVSLWLWAWQHPIYKIPYDGPLKPIVIVQTGVRGVPVPKDVRLGVELWQAHIYTRYLQYEIKYVDFQASYTTRWEKPYTVVEWTGSGTLPDGTVEAIQERILLNYHLYGVPKKEDKR